MRASSAQAFTLLEVMLAAFVLVLALSAAIVGLQTGFNYLNTARASTMAAQAMQGELERLRLLDWTAISSLPASAEVSLDAAYTSSAVTNGTLEVTRTVSDVSGYGSPATLKDIVLTAAWTSSDGQTHTRTLRMRYAKGGLFDYYYSSAGG